MARLAIIGHPDMKVRIENWDHWPSEGWEAPEVLIPMRHPGPILGPPDRYGSYGPPAMTKVAYPFYKKLSDGTLVYKRPGYVVGSL